MDTKFTGIFIVISVLSLLSSLLLSSRPVVVQILLLLILILCLMSILNLRKKS